MTDASERKKERNFRSNFRKCLGIKEKSISLEGSSGGEVETRAGLGGGVHHGAE